MNICMQTVIWEYRQGTFSLSNLGKKIQVVYIWHYFRESFLSVVQENVFNSFH